MNSRAIWE